MQELMLILNTHAKLQKDVTYEKSKKHKDVMDRLDYLKRDSFFTGVSEGVISSDRIIKMLHVKKGKLVVEHKAIYSIEKLYKCSRITEKY